MSEKQIKHLKWTLASYVYNHYWTCAIFRSIFATSIWNTCNISLKHFKQIKTYSCNIRFQRHIPLLLDRMEAHRCMMFTGGSGPTALIGGGPAEVVARHGTEASVARAAGRAWPRELERATTCRTWQGQQLSAVTWRWPRAVPGKASAQALQFEGGHTQHLVGPAAVR
jgi:hypothetical protein